MTLPTLGRLERVDLRTIWTTEDRVFTPWLAREENLAILGETIGLELELEAEEKNVGAFRADILCKSTLDDSWVLIENQLERTDHTHLGQLMTYAAGLQTVTIVWVAAQFAEEHRAALDWLNEITDERFRFFGLEVELRRIGDSLAAPKFNIISKPNDWSRMVSEGARKIAQGELSELRLLQLEFWNALNQYVAENGIPVGQPKPAGVYWLGYPLGKTGFHLSAHFSVRDQWIGVSLYCSGSNGPAHLAALRLQQGDIEREIGEPLEWDDARRKAEISIAVDPNDRERWPDYFKWLTDRLLRFDRALRPRLKTLALASGTEGASVDLAPPEARS